MKGLAISYYKRAIELGYVESMYNYALMLLDGRGAFISIYDII